MWWSALICHESKMYFLHPSVYGEEISLKSASVVLYEYIYEPGTREKLTRNVHYGNYSKARKEQKVGMSVAPDLFWLL